MKLKFLFLLLFIQLKPVFCQELYKTTLGRKDGLPSLNIYSSFEDKEGFMWFSSDMSILKYDGFKFVNFDIENGLADNENFNFFQDSKGRIWFYSYNGKLSYFYKNKFYSEKNDKNLIQPKDLGLIIQICESDTGEIKITYRNGTVYILNFKTTNKYLTFTNNPIYFCLQNGNYFTSKGIYNSVGNCVTPFENDKNISNFYIRKFKTRKQTLFCIQ